jgi:large subunit ribosomal protein L15
MKLNDIKPARGAVRKRKRIGRGPGSGHGGTATKGHKGQQARAGRSKRKAFEGGQMQLTRRIPKFGFKNPFRVTYRAINVGMLDKIFDHGATVDIEALIEHGVLSKRSERIKLLATGELTKKLDVRVDAASQAARQKVEGAGGSVQLVATRSAAAAVSSAGR